MVEKTEFRSVVRSAMPKVLLALAGLIALTSLMTYWRTEIPERWLWGLASPLNVDAFLVSLWASILVTVVFGLLTVILSIQNPEKAEIGQRVKILFSRKDQFVPEAATRYLTDKVQELAAVASKGDIDITVRQYDAAQKAFKLDVVVKFSMINMLHDLECKTPLILEVSPDPVSGAVIGEVRYFRSRCDRTNTEVNGDCTEIASGTSYHGKIEMRIKRGGSCVYEYSFWAWCKEGEPWLSAARFLAANVTVKVRQEAPSVRVNVDSYLVEDTVPKQRVRTAAALAKGSDCKPFDNLTLEERRHRAAIVLTAA